MKLIIGRVASSVLVASGWLLLGARTVLDLIGYSTIPEDIAVAKTRLDQAIDVFLSIPWWALLGGSLISTLWLMWVSWPRSLAAIHFQETKTSNLSTKQNLELIRGPEIYFPGEKGIYIARVFAELDKLAEDLVMHFVLLGFNSSGYAFKFESIEGSVSFVSKLVEGSNLKVDLPTPRFAVERSTVGKVGNLTEFMFLLEQRIPKAIVDEVLQSAIEKHSEFHFENLKVIVSAESTKMRLPIWQAITIRKPMEQFTTGRIVFASAVMTI